VSLLQELVNGPGSEPDEPCPQPPNLFLVKPFHILFPVTPKYCKFPSAFVYFLRNCMCISLLSHVGHMPCLSRISLCKSLQKYIRVLGSVRRFVTCCPVYIFYAQLPIRRTNSCEISATDRSLYLHPPLIFGGHLFHRLPEDVFVNCINHFSGRTAHFSQAYHIL
jgi:hypothetical protein